LRDQSTARHWAVYEFATIVKLLAQDLVIHIPKPAVQDFVEFPADGRAAKEFLESLVEFFVAHFGFEQRVAPFAVDGRENSAAFLRPSFFSPFPEGLR
jgi:hypothetical protein